MMSERNLQVNGNQVTRGGATVGAFELIDGVMYFVPEGDNFSMSELAELVQFMEQES